MGNPNPYSKVAPFNAMVQYFDPQTKSGMTEQGFRQVATLQQAQGVAPAVDGPPTQPGQPGAFVFHAATRTLYFYDGQSWGKGIVLP